LLARGGLYAALYEIQSRATDTPSYAKEGMELWKTGREN
jgi:hypothetical protein